jgi:hypothetical protein
VCVEGGGEGGEGAEGGMRGGPEASLRHMTQGGVSRAAPGAGGCVNYESRPIGVKPA